MLPFFRKIRWRLARDNQFFKYSRYAVGEIVLVVVGILIALYINNWNEQRKDNQKLKIYVQGLVSDLQKDTTNLNKFIAFSQKERVHLKKIEKYMKGPVSVITIDSIISMLPSINYMNPAPEPFNLETFNTLVATGDVGLIPHKQMDHLKNLNFLYKDFEKESENSMRIILETLMAFLNKYGYLTDENKESLAYLSQTKIFDEAEFLRLISMYVGSKHFLYGLMVSRAENVLDQSEKTLSSLIELQ